MKKLKLILPVNDIVYHAVRDSVNLGIGENQAWEFEHPDESTLTMTLPDTEEARQLFLALIKIAKCHVKKTN